MCIHQQTKFLYHPNSFLAKYNPFTNPLFNNIFDEYKFSGITNALSVVIPISFSKYGNTSNNSALHCTVLILYQIIHDTLF